MPAKLDIYKANKEDYAAPKKPVLLRLKPIQYLAIAGQGAPGGERFTACIGALFGVAFTIKMTLKFAGKQDYSVCKLEGLWFQSNMESMPREQWKWKLLIRTPDFIIPAHLKEAVAKLLSNGKSPEVKEVALETLDERQCVQMLHVGPYERECETVAQMEAFARAKGFKLAGPHHEIYLSDPRRVPAARLKTILRERVVKA